MCPGGVQPQIEIFAGLTASQIEPEPMADIDHAWESRDSHDAEALRERPATLEQSCQWCGAPIPAKPLLPRGKKWCSQRCCLAAYNSRKRAARQAVQEERAA